VLEALEEFRADCNPELEITSNLDKKCILIQDKSLSLTLKLKLLREKASSENEE